MQSEIQNAFHIHNITPTNDIHNMGRLHIRRGRKLENAKFLHAVLNDKMTPVYFVLLKKEGDECHTTHDLPGLSHHYRVKTHLCPYFFMCTRINDTIGKLLQEFETMRIFAFYRQTRIILSAACII